MQTARQILEAGSTLVIHSADRTTDFLKAIYDGMGYPVISGQVKGDELMQQIEQHNRVFALGHGSPSGVFTHNGLLDDRYGQLFAEKKDGLYIWCNADAYAKRNKLSGLVSGMFISEVMEARMFGIEATQAEVTASNENFARIVRQCLDEGVPHSTVRERYTSATCKITKFNSERLYVFNQGEPTPALHSSSYAVKYPEQKTSSVRGSESYSDWRSRTGDNRPQPPVDIKNIAQWREQDHVDYENWLYDYGTRAEASTYLRLVSYAD